MHWNGSTSSNMVSHAEVWIQSEVAYWSFAGWADVGLLTFSRTQGPGEAQSWKIPLAPPTSPGKPQGSFLSFHDSGRWWSEEEEGKVSCEKSKPQPCTMWDPNLYSPQVWYSQAKKFDIKIVKLLGSGTANAKGAFPEPRAHSTPAGAGRKPDKLSNLEQAEELPKLTGNSCMASCDRSQQRILQEQGGGLRN